MADERIPTDDALREILAAKLGGNWNEILKLEIRASSLYWIAHLAELGIQLKAGMMKKDKTVRTSEMIASVASWRMDLDAVVESVRGYLESKHPTPKERPGGTDE